MKRWQWVSLVVLAGLAAAALAVLPFRGSGNTSHTLAQQQPALELDMIQDAGGTWCNPVDSSAETTVGDTYTVAVCLTDAPAPPDQFQFELVYATALNDCVDSTSSDFDNNPDANLGATTFDGTLPATANGLGTNWNCNLQGLAPPTCSNLEGHAFLQCNTLTGTRELPVGQGVSEPIAVVTFQAIAGGVDNLDLVNAQVSGIIEPPFSTIYIDCFGVDEFGLCLGAEDTKEGEPPEPTATATNTAIPTATRELCGPNERFTCTPTPRPFTRTPTPGPTGTSVPPTEGAPPPPPPPPPAGGGAPTVIPPATGQGPGMPWGAPVTAIIVGIAAVSLISSGLFVRFAAKR